MQVNTDHGISTLENNDNWPTYHFLQLPELLQPHKTKHILDHRRARSTHFQSSDLDFHTWEQSAFMNTCEGKSLYHIITSVSGMSKGEFVLPFELWISDDRTLLHTTNISEAMRPIFREKSSKSVYLQKIEILYSENSKSLTWICQFNYTWAHIDIIISFDVKICIKKVECCFEKCQPMISNSNHDWDVNYESMKVVLSIKSYVL